MTEALEIRRVSLGHLVKSGCGVPLNTVRFRHSDSLNSMKSVSRRAAEAQSFLKKNFLSSLPLRLGCFARELSNFKDKLTILGVSPSAPKLMISRLTRIQGVWESRPHLLLFPKHHPSKLAILS